MIPAGCFLLYQSLYTRHKKAALIGQPLIIILIFLSQNYFLLEITTAAPARARPAEAPVVVLAVPASVVEAVVSVLLAVSTVVAVVVSPPSVVAAASSPPVVLPSSVVAASPPVVSSPAEALLFTVVIPVMSQFSPVKKAYADSGSATPDVAVSLSE